MYSKEPTCNGGVFEFKQYQSNITGEHVSFASAYWRLRPSNFPVATVQLRFALFEVACLFGRFQFQKKNMDRKTTEVGKVFIIKCSSDLRQVRNFSMGREL